MAKVASDAKVKAAGNPGRAIDLAHGLMLLSIVVGNAFTSIFERYGLLTAEWIILDTIERFGMVRAADIALRWGINKSTLSRGVRAMTRRSLIERRKTKLDHRAALLVLTPKGRALKRKCDRILQENAVEMESAILPEIRSAFHEGLLAIEYWASARRQ